MSRVLTAGELSRAEILLEMGWRWRVVGTGAVAHLVPARLGPLSRTACGVKLHDEARLTAAEGLLGAAPACARCGGGEQR